MSRVILQQSRFSGLSYGSKEGLKSSFLFARGADYRTDPSKIKILPRTLKVSGSVVTDLIMDGDRQSTDTYFYGNAGYIYKRESDETWGNLHTVPDSHGNGIKYFGEDSYLYYTSDAVLGRYGPFGGTKTFVDDFLGAEGGVPLNTHSLDLELDSSQYATAADHASLSITGDITIEACIKLESLPAVGVEQTFVSKWNESGNQRSYYFGLYGISGYFGDGSDGALTISTDTTQAPIDSAATGTAAAYTLSATNASFAVGQKILIHQSRGTGAGKWERNEIAGYTAGTITLTDALTNSYTTGAQVLVLLEYTNVAVNSGKTWTAKAWNGTVGGILAFLASGTVTIAGTITATGKGHNGGVINTERQGDSPTGVGSEGVNTANGMGGGGGDPQNAGGGAGHGTVGTAGGTRGAGGTVGAAGETGGTADLTTLQLGAAGGSADNWGADGGGAGGTGGGAILIIGATIADITGSIIANGNAGTSGSGAGGGGGGGGSGGSILIKAQTATLGTNKITATGGGGGAGGGGTGGTGGVGRIHLDYYTSYTGTTSPTLDVTQDDTLVTTTSYQLRFGVSNDGTAEEYLTKTLSPDPITAQWYRFAVAWDASASTAYFYRDGSLLGQSSGTKTAIYDGTALLGIGASFSGAGAAENFLDGKFDDGRIWNDIRTTTELFTYREVELAGVEANLQAYYQVDNSTDDASPNTNTLTLVNSPSYDAADVPFSSPTTRNDLDQSLNTSGQTYTLPTTISEGTDARQTFVPAKDPQKSIEVLVAAKGTGDWTLTVHDGLNRVIATKTIVNANVVVGDNEFIFSAPWRPVIGASYHFHLTSTVANGTVTTTTLNDLETVDFHTYYQFLVEDDFHPIEHHIEKLNIGNERYLATYNGITYNPHRLTLPSGYRIRCLGKWRGYLVMGVTRGTNIEDYDIGYLFFWDGYSKSYNFYEEVPEGGINAILSGDPLYFIAGYSADLMKYAGGEPQKIRRMPNVGTSVLEVNPRAMAMWKALVHIGMCEDSTSTDVYRGVYSYGRLHRELGETLSFDYPLSLGITQSADLEIGMLFPIGSSLFISWRNGTSYGVDSVAPTNNPYPDATIEFLITDMGKISGEKQALTLRALFKKLVNGESVAIKYKIDRVDSWTEGTAVTTADKKEARLPLPTKGGRFDEFQFGLNLETTVSTSPEVYGICLEADDLKGEKRV